MADGPEIRIVFTLPPDHARAERRAVTVVWPHVPRIGDQVHLEKVQVELLNSNMMETASVGGEVVSVMWIRGADGLRVDIRLR